MAGIYLHIPFCKTRCTYCDFFSSTHWAGKDIYTDALCRELTERKAYLRGEPVRTVYLGGGTPSQLTELQLCRLFDTLAQVYDLSQAEEITMEANPDDLTADYLAMLHSLPVNRLSIGIQTFHDPTLQLLNRRHTAAEAREAVERSRQAGFAHISIDLMYGLPGETDAQWAADLQQAVALGVEHISAYHLTYETGTTLYKMLRRQQISAVDEERSLHFFTMLTDALAAAGYEQYEISNFSLPGCHSRHNSAYWEGIPYLGCGAAAHSFDGVSRRWNIASVDSYTRSVRQGIPYDQTETLDLTTRYNETIITRLRTRAGLSVDRLAADYGDRLQRYCLQQAEPYLQTNRLQLRNGILSLTREGIFLSDAVMRDLLWV
ncbi:MAG: radical SAM family heme chaperone HemW [Prevotellaceae bacterium]|jgi:oxygen-independent coproporphyrinogen-3 oxidase|nr:radical SAM family heme chaperone HemW [Prevotellaceae bacterium]